MKKKGLRYTPGLVWLRTQLLMTKIDRVVADVRPVDILLLKQTTLLLFTVHAELFLIFDVFSFFKIPDCETRCCRANCAVVGRLLPKRNSDSSKY
jgi:hypothetical protein